MNQQQFGAPSRLGVRPSTQLAAGFVTQSFVWMFLGLLVTAGVSWTVASNERLVALVSGAFLPLVIAQFAIVIGLSFLMRRLSAMVALFLFFVYAALTGVTFAGIFLAYDLGTISYAFLSASAMFGGAAVFGAVTQRDLSALGRFFMMGLIGIIAASLLNGLVFRSSGGDFAISIAGVLLFAGLTAYDIQRIKSGDLAAWLGSMEKASVMGALRLYLDFINLFLMFLRLFGSRR